MSSTPSSAPIVARVIVLADAADRARLRDLGPQLRVRAEIDEAATRDEAFARLEAMPYDVVVVDLRAVHASGGDVIAHLRERWPTVACVLLTSLDDAESIASAMRAGAIDHLPKEGLVADRLEQAIRNALRVGAVERELAASRAALERQVGLLGSLVEVAARIHQTSGADQAVSVAVRAASTMFAARVSLDLVFEGRKFHGVHDPFPSPAAAAVSKVRVPLLGLEGQPAGELRCEREDPFERAEELAAAQLARTAAVAIERHALFAIAGDRAREREEIVAIVSHDLRAPLQTFAFAVEALRAPLSRAVTDEILERASRTMRQMWRLLDDLLDVSRLHDGKLSVRPVPVSVARVLTQLVEQMGSQAEQRKIALRAELPKSDLTVPADESRLHQALGNLIANAIRHARSSVGLRAIVEDRAIRFEVTDDGPGVDPALRPHLFDRLFQSKGAGRGALGLGLYIVRGIVLAHGGTVGVDDAIDGGSVFWIRLRR